MNLATNTALNTQNVPVSFLEPLKAYLRAKDPTEYVYAKEYHGSWTAWEEHSQKPENVNMIGQWRKELNMKLRSEALARILEAAQGETRDALSANKYIYEALGEDKGKVGRPTKEAISKEASKLFEDHKLREEAYERILNAKDS